MQLTSGRLAFAIALTLAWLPLRSGEAQGRASISTTVFHEGFRGPLNTTVIAPSAEGGGQIGEHVEIDVGWNADIVSGASVAVVDAPASGVDAIASATRYADFRNTARAGIGFLGERTRFGASYSYGRENDYTSHALALSARAELFERNTTFELRFSRAFDRACTLRQLDVTEAVNRQRLPSSEGCFGGSDRRWLDVGISSFEAVWTQNWTPRIAMQTTLSAQLLDGFQSNAYRAVWLGNSAAQEHHPEHRARYSASVDLRMWARRLRGAFHLSARGYRDTWDIASVTAELAYEQRLSHAVRVRVRGRYYRQSGAAFYSDDYVLAPRGRYFTGDRELAPMSSFLTGGRFEWTVPPGEDGRIGVFSELAMVLKLDYLRYDFDFHYGNVAVPNNFALIGAFSFDGSF